jgi:hypothetical protein
MPGKHLWQSVFLFLFIYILWANGDPADDPLALNEQILQEMGYTKGKDG